MVWAVGVGPLPPAAALCIWLQYLARVTPNPLKVIFVSAQPFRSALKCVFPADALEPEGPGSGLEDIQLNAVPYLPCDRVTTRKHRETPLSFPLGLGTTQTSDNQWEQIGSTEAWCVALVYILQCLGAPVKLFPTAGMHLKIKCDDLEKKKIWTKNNKINS